MRGILPGTFVPVRETSCSSSRYVSYDQVWMETRTFSPRLNISHCILDCPKELRSQGEDIRRYHGLINFSNFVWGGLGSFCLHSLMSDTGSETC